MEAAAGLLGLLQSSEPVLLNDVLEHLSRAAAGDPAGKLTLLLEAENYPTSTALGATCKQPRVTDIDVVRAANGCSGLHATAGSSGLRTNAGRERASKLPAAANDDGPAPPRRWQHAIVEPILYDPGPAAVAVTAAAAVSGDVGASRQAASAYPSRAAILRSWSHCNNRNDSDSGGSPCSRQEGAREEAAPRWRWQARMPPTVAAAAAGGGGGGGGGAPTWWPAVSVTFQPLAALPDQRNDGCGTNPTAAGACGMGADGGGGGGIATAAAAAAVTVQLDAADSTTSGIKAEEGAAAAGATTNVIRHTTTGSAATAGRNRHMSCPPSIAASPSTRNTIGVRLQQGGRPPPMATVSELHNSLAGWSEVPPATWPLEPSPPLTVGLAPHTGGGGGGGGGGGACSEVSRLREAMVLAGLTPMTTAICFNGGQVLYQNAASVAYFGRRMKQPTASVAASPLAGMSAAPSAATATAEAALAFGQMRSDTATAVATAATVAAAAAAAAASAAAAFGGDGVLSDSRPRTRANLLKELFCLEPNKLDRLLLEVCGEGHLWRGIIRVPASCAPRLPPPPTIIPCAPALAALPLVSVAAGAPAPNAAVTICHGAFVSEVSFGDRHGGPPQAEACLMLPPPLQKLQPQQLQQQQQPQQQQQLQQQQQPRQSVVNAQQHLPASSLGAAGQPPASPTLRHLGLSHPASPVAPPPVASVAVTPASGTDAAAAAADCAATPAVAADVTAVAAVVAAAAVAQVGSTAGSTAAGLSGVGAAESFNLILNTGVTSGRGLLSGSVGQHLRRGSQTATIAGNDPLATSTWGLFMDTSEQAPPVESLTALTAVGEALATTAPFIGNFAGDAFRGSNSTICPVVPAGAAAGGGGGGTADAAATRGPAPWVPPPPQRHLHLHLHQHQHQRQQHQQQQQQKREQHGLQQQPERLGSEGGVLNACGQQPGLAATAAPAALLQHSFNLPEAAAYPPPKVPVGSGAGGAATASRAAAGRQPTWQMYPMQHYLTANDSSATAAAAAQPLHPMANAAPRRFVSGRMAAGAWVQVDDAADQSSSSTTLGRSGRGGSLRLIGGTLATYAGGGAGGGGDGGGDGALSETASSVLNPAASGVRAAGLVGRTGSLTAGSMRLYRSPRSATAVSAAAAVPPRPRALQRGASRSQLELGTSATGGGTAIARILAFTSSLRSTPSAVQAALQQAMAGGAGGGGGGAAAPASLRTAAPPPAEASCTCNSATRTASMRYTTADAVAIGGTAGAGASSGPSAAAADVINSAHSAAAAATVSAAAVASKNGGIYQHARSAGTAASVPPSAACFGSVCLNAPGSCRGAEPPHAPACSNAVRSSAATAARFIYGPRILWRDQLWAAAGGSPPARRHSASRDDLEAGSVRTESCGPVTGDLGDLGSLAPPLTARPCGRPAPLHVDSGAVSVAAADLADGDGGPVPVAAADLADDDGGGAAAGADGDGDGSGCCETENGRTLVPPAHAGLCTQPLRVRCGGDGCGDGGGAGGLEVPCSDGGGAAAAAATADPLHSPLQSGLCWHEVVASPAVDPVTGQDVIILTQTDVSAKVEAERHIAMVSETEHRLLEQIFPRHVLAYMTEEDRPTLGVPRALSPAAGGGGGSGGGVGCRQPPRTPTVRDINKLATSHSEVTLLFADIQGFTPMCKVLEPRVVMSFLNDLFTRFDRRLDEFGVYKVETIGDCYFVAGGLIHEDEYGMPAVRARDSHADPLHAEKVLMFAKAMLSAASEVTLPTTGGPVKMRIGIHSGPVVSGVVGQRMPRFCLFGDTVNTTSRMESTGVPGCIHASEAARNLLRNEVWVPTGGIEVKGKGLMNTYLWAPPESDSHHQLLLCRGLAAYRQTLVHRTGGGGGGSSNERLGPSHRRERRHRQRGGGKLLRFAAAATGTAAINTVPSSESSGASAIPSGGPLTSDSTQQQHHQYQHYHPLLPQRESVVISSAGAGAAVTGLDSSGWAQLHASLGGCSGGEDDSLYSLVKLLLPNGLRVDK